MSGYLCYASGMSYTIIDHTADLGIMVQATDIPSLFIEAAWAMIEIMGARTAISEREILFSVDGYDREDLLIRWLGELLYRIESAHLRIAEITIKHLSDNHLKTRIRGTYQPSPLLANIKAVTYHALAIREVDNHLETTIIFDT